MDFDDKFFTNTLILLETELNDLSQWSVYNGDKYNEEIAQLKTIIEKMKGEK